jgi:hypothetical protein
MPNCVVRIACKNKLYAPHWLCGDRTDKILAQKYGVSGRQKCNFYTILVSVRAFTNQPTYKIFGI